MFDQGSQIVQLVKQVSAGPGQAQGMQSHPSTPMPGAEGPDPVESSRFGQIVKTSNPERSALLDFKNNVMLGKENLSGRTVLFLTGGAEKAVASSGNMSSAVKDAWKNLKGKITEIDDAVSRIGEEGMTFGDSILLSKKLVHLEAGFHLTFTSLQKAAQSFDTILRAQ